MSIDAGRSRLRTVMAGLQALIVVGAFACEAEEPDRAGPDRTHTAPRSEPKDQLWPLTGRPVAGKLPNRPVLVVKVDNTSSAEPQIGLNAADVVVEEPVEGGLSRLAAFYHSRLPRVVGPVRSIRTTDVALTAPVDGTLVASGGAPPAHAAARRSDVAVVALGGAGLFRAERRPAPYNVMLRPRATAKAQPNRRPERALLPWARGRGPDLGGAPTHSLTTTFSPAHTTRWHFRSGHGWVRAGDRAAAGQDFVADTVVVLRVRTRPAGYRDPAGNPVPEAVLDGGGRASILAGPRLTTARWRKDGRHAPFRLIGEQGERLALSPGNTWIALVPASGSVAAR